MKHVFFAVSSQLSKIVKAQSLRSHRYFCNLSENKKCQNDLPAITSAQELEVSQDQLITPDDFLKGVSEKPPEHVHLFNIAAYANKSPLLQEFIKLGVNLDKIEKTKGAGEVILKLDFDRDVKPYIRFLHDHGVKADDLGHFITRNPFIFREHLENLQIRINYLEAKLFTPQSISRIISKNPSWLSYSTTDIDHRLGFFQSLFSLDGPEVRHITVRMPKLITHPLRHVEVVRFGVIEEMGFTKHESKVLLLERPKIYTLKRQNVVSRFSFVHNEMGLPHSLIVTQPAILTYRESRIRERHLFLKSIGKAQYDPVLPHYVSLKALVSDTDAEFCKNIAKSSIFIYNKFLKTL